MPARPLFLALFVAVLALPACDAFGADPGTFSVTVEGDRSDSFSGEPVTTINPASSAGPERSYQFRFATPGARQVITITAVTDGQATLTEGDYPVQRFSGDRTPGRAEATADLEGDLFFFGVSGTLAIEDADGDRVRGSFEFQGSGAEGADGEAVTVQGTFEADLDRTAITT